MHGLIRSARHGAHLLLLACAACAHDEPFATGDSNTLVPLVPSEPARLTWSEFGDHGPAWLPDGGGFLYSYVRTDSDERDRCLGVLPASGGQRVREICRRTLADGDSVDMLDLPSASAGGLLAYRRAVSTLFNDVMHQELVAATLADPLPGVIVTSLPFTGVDGGFYTSVSQPRWVGESGLVFLGRVQEIVTPCPGCDPFVIERNNGILYAPADGSRTVTPVPGTGDATSVAAAPDGTILFTRDGDTRVYRRHLGTGEESIVYDVVIAAPSDIAAAGDRIAVAVPGGIHIVDLGTGASSTVAAAGYTGLALSPDGSIVIGEAIDPVTFDSDLWRVMLP
jgi:hypothetical protein